MVLRCPWLKASTLIYDLSTLIYVNKFHITRELLSYYLLTQQGFTQNYTFFSVVEIT